jgi:hypothetical protein
MTLSARQQQAQAIASELHKLGAAVICVLPLKPGDNICFQVIDDQCAAVLEKVSLWGWSPILRSTGPRFTPKGACPAAIYEIALPADRQTVPQEDRRVPRYEIVEREKQSAAELKAMKKHLGLT